MPRKNPSRKNSELHEDNMASSHDDEVLDESWTFVGEVTEDDPPVATITSQTNLITEDAPQSLSINADANISSADECDIDDDGDISDGISIISESDRHSRASPASLSEFCCRIRRNTPPPEIQSEVPHASNDIKEDINTASVVEDAQQNAQNRKKSNPSIHLKDSDWSLFSNGGSTKSISTSTSSISSSTRQLKRLEFSPSSLVLFGVLAGITGIALGHFLKLTREDCAILQHITPLVRRITDLENENTQLRIEIGHIKADAIPRDDIDGDEQLMMHIFPQPLQYYIDNELNTDQMVWTGDSTTDGPVLIPNRKLEIPKFCYEPGIEDDLLAEHYAKFCDKRERKMAKLVQRESENRHQSKQTFADKKVLDIIPEDSTLDTISDTADAAVETDIGEKNLFTIDDDEADFADDEDSLQSTESIILSHEKIYEHVDKESNAREKYTKHKYTAQKSESKYKTVDNSEKKSKKKAKAEPSPQSSEKEFESLHDKKYKKQQKDAKEKREIYKSSKQQNSPSKENRPPSPSLNSNESVDSNNNLEWTDKRRKGRAEMRKRHFESAEEFKENWFLARGSNREKHRDDKPSKKKDNQRTKKFRV